MPVSASVSTEILRLHLTHHSTVYVRPAGWHKNVHARSHRKEEIGRVTHGFTSLHDLDILHLQDVLPDVLFDVYRFTSLHGQVIHHHPKALLDGHRFTSVHDLGCTLPLR